MNRTQTAAFAEDLRSLVKTSEAIYVDLSRWQVHSEQELPFKKRVLDFMAIGCDGLLEAYSLLNDSLEAGSTEDLAEILEEHTGGAEP